MAESNTEGWQDYYRCVRHTNVVGPWHLDPNKTDALKIKVNTDIALTAVILYGPTRSNSSEINIKIINHLEEEIHAQQYETRTERCEMQTVRLYEAIPIRANENFTLMVDSPNVEVHYGTTCQPIWREKNIEVTFDYSPKCTTDTNEEQGQIAGIEFSA